MSAEKITPPNTSTRPAAASLFQLEQLIILSHSNIAEIPLVSSAGQ